MLAKLQEVEGRFCKSGSRRVDSEKNKEAGLFPSCFRVGFRVITPVTENKNERIWRIEKTLGLYDSGS